MNRVLVIIYAIFAFSSASVAQTVSVVTLEESIAIAIKNNIEVKQRDLLVDMAAVDYKQSKANLFPTVNGQISHGINQGRSIDPFTNTYANQTINYASYGLGSEVILFNGLTLRQAIRQNSFAYDASKMELQQAKDNLTLAVILAYLQVLSNEDLAEVAGKQVAVAQVQVERLEKLNEQGAINPPQLYDVRGQLKEAQLNVVTAQNAIASSKLLLTQLMNVSYNPALKLKKIGNEELMEKFPASADEVYNNASNALAVVKAAELRRKSAEAGVKTARGNLYPTLSFGGNINTNFSSAATQEVFTGTTEEPTSAYVLIGGNKEPVLTTAKNYQADKISYSGQIKNNIFSNVGLTLRVPLFNSFAAKNRVSLATIKLKSAALTVDNTKIQLRQEVEQAYLNMQNAWNRYKILLEQVEAYAASFNAAEVRFNAGVGTSVDYMIAKNNLDQSSLNLVTAKYDYLLRKRILAYYNTK